MQLNRMTGNENETVSPLSGMNDIQVMMRLISWFVSIAFLNSLILFSIFFLYISLYKINYINIIILETGDCVPLTIG